MSRPCRPEPIYDKKKFKDSNIELIFLDGDKHWQSLTNKRTVEFLAAKTLREKFGGLNIMKSVLNLDKTPPSVENLISAAVSSRLNYLQTCKWKVYHLKSFRPWSKTFILRHGKHRKKPALACASSLGVNPKELAHVKADLKSMQDELLNNTSKLTEINKRIEKETKMLEEVKNGPTYTDEQRQLCWDRLDDLNTEKQARLEILSQNQKDLQTQVARIKQTIAKVLDQDTSLAEGICTLLHEQGITIFTILSALSTTISTIVLAITGVFGEVDRGAGGSPPKDEGTLKKWPDRLADALKRLAGKAVKALQL